MSKYLIHCPKCRSTFDVSEQLEIWRSEFINEIDKIIKKMREKK